MQFSMTILSLVKRRVQDVGSGTPACGPQAPGDLWPNSAVFATEDSEMAPLYITSQLGQGVVCTLENFWEFASQKYWKLLSKTKDGVTVRLHLT